MFLKTVYLTAALLILTALTGCQQTTEPKATTSSLGPSQPKTFREAVEQLVTMKNQIRDGFAVGDVDSAHGPLHEVGHVLENIASLAQQAELSPEQLDAVKQAKEALFDAFGEIDKTLHGAEGSTYEEEADKIKAAMLVISTAAGVEDATDASSNQTASDAGLPDATSETVDASAIDAD